MLKNMRLKNKFLLGFSTMLVFLLLIGIGNLFAINSLSSKLTTVTTQSLPAQKEMIFLRRNIEATEKLALEIIVAQTQSEMDALLKELQAEREKIDINIEKLMVLTPPYQQNLEEIQKQLGTVATYREQLIVEANKLTTEGNAAAYEIYQNSYDPAFQQVASQIDELSERLDNAIEISNQGANSMKQALMIGIPVALVVAVILSCWIAIRMTKGILGPIHEIKQNIGYLETGDFSQLNISYHATNELGEIADAMRSMAEKIVFIIEDLGFALNAMANGDFTQKSKNSGAYVGEYQKLMQCLYRLMTGLRTVIQQIDLAATQVSTESEQVSAGAQALSQGTTEQASSIEELAATINDISQQVKDNAENATKAKLEANEVNTEVQDSNNKMLEMNQAMEEISAKSDEISKIIKVIEDIAFQTNILALNAAVEAARAGAAGKGFAVVADEVRNLAHKSSQAAKSTTLLITDTVKAVNHGVTISNEVKDSINQIYHEMVTMAQRVDSIADASNNQAMAIEQITVGIDQISSVIQTNSATSEESAAASEELASQAALMKSSISVFQFSND